MIARLVLFFTIFPLIELALLLTLGKYTSVSTTIAFVLITGLIGALLLRWQGWHTWRKVQQDLQAGRAPTDSLVDGLLIVIASLLLITPGVLTDLVGITLLIPPLRALYRRAAAAYFQKRFQVVQSTAQQGGQSQRTEVIDSYIVENPPPIDRK